MKGELLLVECEPLGSAVEALQSAPGVMDAAVFGNALHLVVQNAPIGRFRSCATICGARRRGCAHGADAPEPGRRICLADHPQGSDRSAGMSWTRLLAVARKEVIQILRDARSLMIVIVMPADPGASVWLRREPGSETSAGVCLRPGWQPAEPGSAQTFSGERIFHDCRSV